MSDVRELIAVWAFGVIGTVVVMFIQIAAQEAWEEHSKRKKEKSGRTS